MCEPEGCVNPRGAMLGAGPLLSGLCNLTSRREERCYAKEFTTRTPHPYPCFLSLPAQFGTHLERKVSFRVAAFVFKVCVCVSPCILWSLHLLLLLHPPLKLENWKISSAISCCKLPFAVCCLSVLVQRPLSPGKCSSLVPRGIPPFLDGIIKFLAAITAVWKVCCPSPSRNCMKFKFYIQQDIWRSSCFYIAQARKT